MTKTLLLDCGSGGRASQRLINELFLKQFDNPILRTLDDAARLELSGPIAMSKKKDTPRPLPDTLGLPPTGADSHAHLDSEGLLERLPEVMERARNAGLATIGQVFLSPSAYYEHRDAFAAHPGVFFMLGIHPCDGQECTGAVLKAMRDAFAGDDRDDLFDI